MHRARFCLHMVCLALLSAVLAAWPAVGLSAGEGRSGATAPADLLPSSSLSPSSSARAPVDPRVERQLGEHGAADVLVLLGPQPDLSPAYALSGKEERGRWVWRTLRDAAETAQRPVLAQLAAEGVPHRSFWVVNAVAARLTAGQVARVRALPGVAAVTADAAFRGLPDPVIGAAEAASPEAIAWGVARVKAEWAWLHGYTGQGIVIAGQDTGYAWTHPALIRTYRGYDAETGSASHDYNWHDSIHADIGTPNTNSCGYNMAAPCDDGSHGTHTMGTMVGNDLAPGSQGWPASAEHAIGVAPGARWIGCRNMDEGDGNPSSYIECFEWLIAPYPTGGTTADGDPGKAPDVINNSWGCPPSEGCVLGTEIELALNAADAAGILVVVSAGNLGSACDSVDHAPAIYPRAFSVGATMSSGDGLASFSSRGPVTYDGRTFIKPDLSGPGVSVPSSVPGGGYSTMSGTSMAGPHVAGVAALLLSAEPSLRGQTGMVKAILARTADPKTYDACGPAPAAVPNNGYGWGIVNAQRAIESLALSGSLSGTVTVAGSAAALPGATVRLYAAGGTDLLDSAATDASGAYGFSRSWGAYRLEASAPGHDPAVAEPVYVVGGQVADQDFALAPVPAVADFRILRSGADALLRWTAPTGNVASYELWRDTAPYFAPVPGGSAAVIADGSACTVEGGAITCIDAGVIGGVETHHFYLVRAVGAGGGVSAPSSGVGEFEFQLAP